ncbi:MAG: hypothetical protein ACOC8F_07145, partial [Planctomycetota bacterium]
MPHRYDIAILGCTPAGYAAAGHLARRGRDVVVVGAPHAAVESPLADWVPGDFFRMSHLPGGMVRRTGAAAFKRVCYHDAGLQRREERRSRTVMGYVAPPGAVGEALQDSARDAGATLLRLRQSPALRLGDERVRIEGANPIEARLLMVVHGRLGDILSDLALPPQSAPPSPLIATGLDVPLEGDDGGLDGALHVVEAAERSEMGLLFVTDGTLHVRIVSSSAAAGNRAAELSSLVAELQAAEILPARLPLGSARGGAWHPPASAALDMETHVAKRCLLAGTAGGFAGSITGQTLWPSVRSALLAADVADDALEVDDPQDALETFRDLWRRELGDYLRPPSTALQMLLPLL